jgi:tRNA-dihydrouridine synthase 1
MEMSGEPPPVHADKDEAPLSKNARKRLLKAEQKDARKEHRKRERKMRKQQRTEVQARLDAEEQEGVGEEQADSAPAVELTLEERRTRIWSWWKRFGSPRLVLAPMVNQSELAFRLLSRRHGAGLTYTPMLHSTRFTSEEAYRLENFDEHSADRPLVAQFCGDDPATLLAAAKMVQARCDAVDLNCGCPQGIARRGHYGAFLLDEPELIENIVRTLARGLSVPVFVKMRVLPAKNGTELGGVDVDATIALARRLEAAGCSLLTLHGRTRAQKCACVADWQTIHAVKDALSIPVLANGGVETPEDLEACLTATGCDGVMTSEAALENPAMFAGRPTSRSNQVAVAREYIELSKAHPPRALAILKAHFFKILFMAFDLHRDLRDQLGASLTPDSV